jgi:MFS family permease
MAPLARLVTALGVAQLISWGTLFYAIGVLGPAMRADLGMSEVFLFGAFTAGLLVSGTLSTRAGRGVDERGGRHVLSIGSGLAAIAMGLIAIAPHPWVVALGWLVAGAAMAYALYDPAFATLAQHAGGGYRRSVTILTVWGGLASTAFWPLSYLLLDAIGWRATFAVYAVMHLAICLPIHLLAVPRTFSRVGGKSAGARERQARTDRSDSRLRWLTIALAIAAFITGVVAVHAVNLLTTAGLTTGEAVAIGMVFGPIQVIGRVLELGIARRVRATTVGLVSFGLMLVAMLALIAVDGLGFAAFVFVVTFGIGNGVLTVVRGTAPMEIFGSEGLGGILGYISRACLFSRALAPGTFSALISLGLGRNAALAALAAVAVAGMASFAKASRSK